MGYLWHLLKIPWKYILIKSVAAICSWILNISVNFHSFRFLCCEQKKWYSCLDLWGKHPHLSTQPPSFQLGQIKCTHLHLEATNCGLPYEEDTSAKGYRAAPTARRGFHPQWEQRLHNQCTTQTRRAHGGEEPCGCWPRKIGQTGGKPWETGAPKHLKGVKSSTIYVCNNALFDIIYLLNQPVATLTDLRG